MARGLNYDKMKQNDFMRSQPRFEKDTSPQKAVVSKADSGAIKVSFRGDQTIDAAMQAIKQALKQYQGDLISNPVLYFYPVGSNVPKKKKPGSIDSWDPRPTMGQTDNAIPPDDGSLPWK